jgi:hypothetical protein
VRASATNLPLARTNSVQLSAASTGNVHASRLSVGSSVVQLLQSGELTVQRCTHRLAVTTGSRFVIPMAIAGLPGATGDRHHLVPRSGAELDGNRRVGIISDRTQRRRAIGA